MNDILANAIKASRLEGRTVPVSFVGNDDRLWAALEQLEDGHMDSQTLPRGEGLLVWSTGWKLEIQRIEHPDDWLEGFYQAVEKDD